MKKIERENMLLFSKERTAGPNRYRLYFTTVSSLRDETPRVFRLLVRMPFTFNKFEIGRLYTLVYSGVYITEHRPEEEFNLSEEHYSKLLQTRDLKFIDKKTSAALRSIERPRFSSDRYYSFRETKEIINFRPDFLTQVAVSTFSFFISGLAFLIPFFLYTYMIYAMIKGQVAVAGFSTGTLAVPIRGLGALPLTMFCMLVLFSLSEFALLRIDFTRWSILKNYTLAWGGIRKSFFFEVNDVQYLKKFGIVSGAALAVCIILSLIV
jgi:hypothetical protein